MSEVRSLHKGEFLELKRDRHWEFVRRVKANGAVVIVAITEAGELVLVEQTRIPLQGKTIELPAGITGDSDAVAGECFISAAHRELLEETGYTATSAEVILQGPTAPGLTSEQLTFVRMRGLQQQHAGGGVDGEDITVHRVPLAAVHGWLTTKRVEGYFIEPRIYTGLWFALNT